MTFSLRVLLYTETWIHVGIVLHFFTESHKVIDVHEGRQLEAGKETLQNQ